MRVVARPGPSKEADIWLRNAYKQQKRNYYYNVIL